MSEKVRSLNLTTGNILATTITPSASTTSASVAAVAAAGTLIGAPTLISSTFNSNASHTQTLIPTTMMMVTTTTTGICGSGSSGGDVSPNLTHNNSDTESSSEYAAGQAAVIAQLSFHLMPDAGGAGAGAIGGGGGGGGGGVAADSNSIMNSSQISANSNDSMQLANSPAAIAVAAGGKGSVVAGAGGNGGKHLAAQNIAGKSCRFPKLEECAHFHYERVQLGPLSVRLVDDKSELLNSSIASQSIGGDIANTNNQLQGSSITTGGGGGSGGGAGPSSFRSFSPSSCWFIIKVYPQRCESFLVKRSFDNMQMLDEMLHRCVYDRKISGLKNLQDLDFKSEEEVEYAVAQYLERFSKIASDSLTCGTILTWLQLDNKGRRLPLADGDTMRTINTPAVGAAYGVRRYQAQASDEISIEVGDMISVIDMPSPAESIWWRGKKSHLQKSHYEVGFFPQSCVATIGDKVPRHFPMPAPLVGQLDVSPTKPVLRKHGKLIAFFRSFILSRPSRRRLKQSGIYRERVFSCDLSEHLLNSGQEIPMVLKCCAEFIEEYGIVDGIYRLSGITSNIQKLRRAFDEERIPDLGNPEMKQDIHAVSSLLKMYFRELPNPLCTYQLYDNFVEAIQEKSESNERLRLMKETVLKLPPPHYRTLKYLSEHLNKISQHSARTGMTDKNLAIVWAPNLLRSPALESGGVAALRGVGVQAVVTEYLIRNCHNIFDALEDSNVRLSYIATAGATPAIEMRMDSLTDCESLLVEQREHDQSLTFAERPKSLSTGGPKLISLEEAQERHSRLDGFDMKASMPINMVTSNAANIGSYIEVGGGPSSLPDKYHTVLSVPRSWQKRKTHSWKSLFTRNQRPISNGGTPHDLKMGRSSASDDNSPPSHHKGTAAQVTFAEADAIITNAGKAGKSLLKQEKPKSIELFETTRSLGGDSSKHMEVCVRSNSIDSLRTAGHSRSVSHDSYFDLLQSPQRGHVTTCPSRELSELGLNFDREEPEMRIFSESESLVSSPRVGKENIPPSSASASRRIMRARPEEFSSQTNSVNPSPKKQPRLNLLLSPSAASGGSGHHGHAHNWSLSSSQQSNNHHHQHHHHQQAIDEAACHEHAHHLISDESCCKRYKLEDQLSDIQYIDCSTPEHTIANPQTLYTSVQVHAPPKSALSKSSLYSSTESTTKLKEAQSSSAKNYTYEKMFAAGNNKPTDSSSSSAASLAAGGQGPIHTRYSYPSVQLGAKRKDQESSNSNLAYKERFSYPGLGGMSSDKRFSLNKMQVEEDATITIRQQTDVTTNNFPPHTRPTPPKPSILPKHAVELMRPKNRNSYCGTNEQLSLLLLRSNSAEISKDAKCINEMERSKLSVTPSSPPIQSPRYSLLMGETSSENSSAVNTPQHDLDPLMVSSIMSGLSGISGTSSQQQQHQHLLGVDACSCLGTSHESLGSNLTSHSTNMNNIADKRDMHALKRELSLDLNNSLCNSSRMTIDHHSSHAASTLPNRQHLPSQQMIPSPNNSNFTDNTSQSVTPSEFCYQHLQRQSSMHSLIETAESSPVYEEYENTPSNLVSPLLHSQQQQQQKLPSPIKSTISITYNLKSPQKGDAAVKAFPPTAQPTVPAPPLPVPMLRGKSKQNKQPQLLETSFDENTVYEQVRFFRNSVTEVNQLLNDERKSTTGINMLESLKDISEEEANEMHDLCAEGKSSQRKRATQKNFSPLKCAFQRQQQQQLQQDKVLSSDEELLLSNNADEDHDIQMSETQTDSLEIFDADEKLLYENVELRKPKSVYENLLGEEMKEPLPSASPITVEENFVKAKDEQHDKLDLDSLDSIKTSSLEQQQQPTAQESTSPTSSFTSSARKSPSNFSVKELATKFESSPVEQLPAFDFSFRSSVKKPQTHTQAFEMKTSQHSLLSEQQQLKNNSAPPAMGGTNLKQKLTKSQQITRSLDENAFVREFGPKHLHDLNARSIQQLPELAEVSNRRKSFDFTRPKTLNPPKRLPGMPITEEICMMKSTEKPPLKHDKLYNSSHHDSSLNGAPTCCSSFENDYESAEPKITPTTENRISLIQNNVAALPSMPATVATAVATDLNNSNLNLSGLKVLSGVKLDRERIDKIKEERRQQLTQKYHHGDSFKSRSKTDLNSTAKSDDDKFPTDSSLRIKSKSRGDIRTIQKDIDNLKEIGRSGVSGSESTLNTPIVTAVAAYAAQHRVRSISDEKNQNCDVNNATTNTNNLVNNTAAAGAGLGISTSTSSSANNTSDSSSASDDFPKKAAPHEEFSARATAQKFERKSLDFVGIGGGGGLRERRGDVANVTLANVTAAGNNSLLSASRNSLTSTREKISPQFSIRDVTAMFESRSQNQQ